MGVLTGLTANSTSISTVADQKIHTVRKKDWWIRSLRRSLFSQRKVTLMNDPLENDLSAFTSLEANQLAGTRVSACMTHPPVTQPGLADGQAIWQIHTKDDSPKQSQGRSILESLDPMPAFTNRARRRAIILQKHPSGKFHLIIMGNCVIRLKVGHNSKKKKKHNSGLLGECYFSGDCRHHTVGLSDSLYESPFNPKWPLVLQSQAGWSFSPSLWCLGTPDTQVPVRSWSATSFCLCVKGRNLADQNWLMRKVWPLADRGKSYWMFTIPIKRKSL